MKVIAKPKKEKEILASVERDAKTEEIKKGLTKRGGNCVNHLCGCGKC